MTRYLKKMAECMRSITLALGLVVGVSQTAHAGLLYECDLNAKRAMGWVSSKMAIVFDDSGRVTVIDSVILNVVGDPIVAKVSKRGDKYRVTWSIANAKDDRGERVPTFRYIADLNTKSKKIAVTAKPVAYPQRFSAKGVCKSRKK